MKQINPIYTREEWNKVRSLAKKWYRQVNWHIPSKGYYLVLVIGIVGAIVSGEYRIAFIILVAFAGAELYAREKQIESYVEGWDQGQDYITGEHTIDELLNFDKPVKKGAP